jgi:hypothetical protein
MQSFLRSTRRTSSTAMVLLGLSMLLLLGSVSAAFAGPASSGSKVTWRNEGYSVAKQWTTGEIGPYS